MDQNGYQELQQRLKQFAVVRNWEQFHSPKNLAMALSGEAGELIEHFQWLTEEQSYQLDDEKKQEVALEMADVLIYLFRLAERLDINLINKVYEKIEINEQRYPVDKVHGSSKKYNEYD